jgi:hypothetical protein
MNQNWPALVMLQLPEPAESGSATMHNRQHGELNGPKMWWSYAAMDHSPIRTWKWRGSASTTLLVAEQIRPMERCHTAMWSENSPATSWSTKMADKATTPIAGQLLWALAMRQRTTHSALPTVAHCAGSRNLLVCTASRSFSCFHHGTSRGTPL